MKRPCAAEQPCAIKQRHAPARRLLFLILGLSASGLALMPCGCSREEAPPPPCASVAGHPVDPTLLAFLSRARSAHHAADRHEDSGNVGGAIEALLQVVDGPIPTDPAPSSARDSAPSEGTPSAPEVREVLADTHARLADLRSRQQDFSGAEQSLERGLQLVPERNYFRGHLFEVRGLVAERQAKQVRNAGDETRAKALEQRALEAFEASMKIQAEVIDQAVGDQP